MFKNGYNFESLGECMDDYEALRRAKNCHPSFKVDGCAYCCPIIHKH